MIAVAIVNTAVVTDVGAPVAAVPVVAAVGIGPVAGRPKIPCFWRFYPDSRHPIIVVVLVGPVARHPEITIFRARRLFVDRQDWGGNRD